MRKTIFILLAFIIVGCNRSSSYSGLAEGFMNPPNSAKPQVWWHWMNGNITTEGIRQDILWFNHIGLGGYHIFDASYATPQIVEDRLVYMDPDWKDAFRLAVNLADSLGMDVTVPSSPGFSSTGGPWVKPENAMKKLVWREMEIEGGQKFEGSLPEPFTSTGKIQNYPIRTTARDAGPVTESHYEDIAVLAVRLPDNYKNLRDLDARISSSGGEFDLDQLTNGDLSDSRKLPAGKDGYAWIQYEFPVPQTICALSIINTNTRPEGHAVAAFCRDSLQISNDGVNFTTVFGIPVGDAHRQSISFNGITARYFRLKHMNPKAYYHYTMSKPAPDPEYSDIAEFVLYPQLRINLSEAKSAFAAAHDMRLYRTPHAGDSDVVSMAIDVTSFCHDGILDWEVPEGKWMIYRFGASLTGKKNHPASPEATGFEVDKLDPDAWKEHFRNYLDLNKEALNGMLGTKGIRNLLVDSYEAGPQNWTPDLCKEFINRRGYDPFPWFPALTGAIVSSTEESERFLFDWRKTIGELFAENYASLDDFISKEYDMNGCFIEAHANGRVFVADGMSMKKNATYPMSEIWIQGPVGTKDREAESISDIRESASVAHIYGQNIVAAESFTAIGAGKQAYTFCPENLKPVADRALAHGVNLFVIHESAHQPLDSHKPGLGLGVYGQWFNRHETWAEQAGAWIQYLARSSFMLQQGNAVSDILWFYGEDNNVTGLYSHSFPDIPAGYNFDFANPDVLLNELQVRDGKLCTKTGMEYSALCIAHDAVVMSEEVRKRIEYFRSKGVTVCGDVSSEIASSLSDKGVTPDWIYSGTNTLNVLHRRLPDIDIYWLNSPEESSVNAEVSLRVSGKKPYLWHPVSGEMKEISYSFVDGRTTLDLDFEPHDAYFIVFKEPTDVVSFDVPEAKTTLLAKIDGAWDVTFEDKFGQKKEFEFESLIPWNIHQDSWARYFSGTATYKQTIGVPEFDGRLLLDLGSVHNIADVYINGTFVSTLWKRPFRTDITDYINGDSLDIEIRVTNLWVNRLIRDSGSETIENRSYTSKSFFTPEDELIPSGLVGEITLHSLL